MKCPECSHEMTSSSQGWLCLACGHVEKVIDAGAITPPPVVDPALTPSSVPPVPSAPQPAPAVLPSGFINPNAPVGTTMPDTSRLQFDRRRRRTMLRFWLVIAVLIAGITIGGYLWVFEPKIALAGYLQRLVTAHTATFATSATVSASDGYKVTVTSDGKYDVRDIAKPKLDVNLKAQIGIKEGVLMPGSAASTGSLSGQLKVIDQSLYIKLSQFTFLTELIPVKLSDEWYKYELANDEATKKCTATTKSSGSLLGASMLTKIPVKNTAFKGVDTIKGAPLLHFTGTMDNAKLQAAVDEANKSLSADCKLDISADDYKNISVSYEVWRGWSSDRLRFSIVDSSAKTNADVTIDTSAYGKPITIDTPANAKDLSEIIQDAFSSMDDVPSEPVTTRTNVPADTATAQQKARDTKRKTDITALRLGLEAYYAENGKYPASLKSLTVRGEDGRAIIASLPVDPLNKSPYGYAYVPGAANQQYTLSACLENAADTSTSVYDPIAPCKTALYRVDSAN